jgi:hypothetical protein
MSIEELEDKPKVHYHSRSSALKKTIHFLVGPKQFLHVLPQRGVPSTSFVQVCAALSGGQPPSSAKNGYLTLRGLDHRVVFIRYRLARFAFRP